MNDLERQEFFRDVFLSHAGADKDGFVRPFVASLERREISYWLDQAELAWGDSLLNQLSEGLRKSQFVLVFVSDRFLARNWPQAELRVALNEEVTTGKVKVLPLLICEPETCFARHPFLRDKKYLKWRDGIDSMVDELEGMLGRSYSKKWTFTHPASYRGHVWIRVMPRAENRTRVHDFTIEWGRWQYEGRIDFGEDASCILDFAKIAEEETWPIGFTISPPAFVVSGRGNPVIELGKGWVDKGDGTGRGKSMIMRRIQSVLPDTESDGARLV